MARLSQIQQLEKYNKIRNCFINSDKTVFSISDIKFTLDKAITYRYVHYKTSLRKFIEYIRKNKILADVYLNFPNRPVARFFLNEPNIFDIAQSIGSDCYFTHYSALFLHNLTDNIPKIIYINKEQSEKQNKTTDLKPVDLLKAFHTEPRISKNIALYEDYKICLLNGKYTNQLGVETKTNESLNINKIKVTGIERTLIDISVSPHYSGGVSEVLTAYKRAKGKFSIKKLAQMLNKLDYIYPYHQVIGFYLEKVGYKENELKIFENMGVKNKFFITRKIEDKNREFSNRWQLYYPKSL
ncbi:MAG: hypothetical protein ACD_20C00209G0009 [uncultured bacterium]|nr:MAG: hypothetical protein ACD_20C00209G0009 [uncultured bacterium]